MVMPGAIDGLGALAAFKKIDRDVPVIESLLLAVPSTKVWHRG